MVLTTCAPSTCFLQMSSDMECWANGVVACATGLTRIQRQQLQQTITSAGGRCAHSRWQRGMLLVNGLGKT